MSHRHQRTPLTAAVARCHSFLCTRRFLERSRYSYVDLNLKSSSLSQTQRRQSTEFRSCIPKPQTRYRGGSYNIISFKLFAIENNLSSELAVAVVPLSHSPPIVVQAYVCTTPCIFVFALILLERKGNFWVKMANKTPLFGPLLLNSPARSVPSSPITLGPALDDDDSFMQKLEPLSPSSFTGSNSLIESDVKPTTEKISCGSLREASTSAPHPQERSIRSESVILRRPTSPFSQRAAFEQTCRRIRAVLCLDFGSSEAKVVIEMQMEEEEQQPPHAISPTCPGTQTRSAFKLVARSPARDIEEEEAAKVECRGDFRSSSFSLSLGDRSPFDSVLAKSTELLSPEPTSGDAKDEDQPNWSELRSSSFSGKGLPLDDMLPGKASLDLLLNDLPLDLNADELLDVLCIAEGDDEPTLGNLNQVCESPVRVSLPAGSRHTSISPSLPRPKRVKIHQ